jgi:hypothetical protein
MVVNNCENYWSQYVTLVRQDKQLSPVQNGWHHCHYTSQSFWHITWCWKGLNHESRYEKSFWTDVNKLEGLADRITNQYFSKSNLFWISITCALSFWDHIRLVWKIIPSSFICLYLIKTWVNHSAFQTSVLLIILTLNSLWIDKITSLPCNQPHGGSEMKPPT